MSKMTISGGYQIWRNEEGQYHRKDGPAVITKNGIQVWFTNNKQHRLDGPAYINPLVVTQWIINGLRHRIDGPAEIYCDGEQIWYINGINITEQAVAWIKENNFPDYTSWTDTQKIMFRLAFSGITS